MASRVWKSIATGLSVAALVAATAAPALADDDDDGGASAAAIAVDLVIARPTMLMATVAGSAFYFVTLPLTAPGGMMKESYERFMKEPGERLVAPLGQ